MPTRRYIGGSVPLPAVSRVVIGEATIIGGDQLVVDVDIPDGGNAASDLDEAMVELGWTLYEATPTGALHSEYEIPVTTSTSATLPPCGGVFPVDTTAGPLTLTLSPLASSAGRFYVKNMGINTLTIDGDGSNIDGAATLALTAQYQSAMLIAGATQWLVFAPS